jgi:hypothetical protein
VATGKTPESLADEIIDLAHKGTIPIPFRVADWSPHVHGFKETHIRTVMANYEKNGDQVRRGRRARFLRAGYGRIGQFEHCAILITPGTVSVRWHSVEPGEHPPFLVCIRHTSHVNFECVRNLTKARWQAGFLLRVEFTTV